MLAIVYGIGQVGHHFVKDTVNNFVVDPIKDSLTGSAIEAAGLDGAANSYAAASNDVIKHASKLNRTAKFFHTTFFK